MKNILKILTIIIAAILALFLTRMGLSYLIILIALGIILPFLTEDKKSAVISGVLYATISYILSYPAGLFLINYMPTIDIPVNVTFTEVFFNLLIGLLIPVVISIIICFISSVIGNYLRKLIKTDKKDKEMYQFNSANDFAEEDEYIPEQNIPKTTKDLLELSPIQRAKNRKKNEKE